MVDLLTISIMVASASVVAGVIYYAFQIRHQNRMRQTDLLLRLYSTMDSLEFLEAWHKIFWMPEPKDYDDFVEKLGGKRHIAAFVVLFYEEVGVLLRRKLIDIGLVDDLFSDSLKLTWEKVRTPMLEVRKRGIYPRAYENFEYLYNEMKKREQRK
jgi:hypothetical protein